MKLEFEEWKKVNPDQDFSQKEYQLAVLNSRAFEYESIRDTQENKEFWFQIAALVVIVGATLVFPPAGIALGAAYGTYELSSAVAGKDLLSGRELDTSERWVRGLLAPLDIVPGVNGVTKFARGATSGLKLTEKLTNVTNKVSGKIMQDVHQVNSLVETAKKMGTARLKSAEKVLKDTGARVLNKTIDDIIETGKAVDWVITKGKQAKAVFEPGLVTTTGHTVKKTVEESHIVQDMMKDVFSRFKVNIDGAKGIDKTRPSWRQSEIDVGKEYPGYRDQVSFKDGNEVSHGTKNSSRPDFYISGHSIEVKNYKVTTSSGRSNLIRNVSNQINKRISDLPEQTKQSVIIDVRGQNVTRDVLRDIKQKINGRTNGVADIIFKMD